MNKRIDATEFLVAKAEEDSDFRERLLTQPKKTIERELGVTVAEGHEIHVHEETGACTHLVLPPKSGFTAEEREAARTGAASLEFLKKTMHDPAPPIRPAAAMRPAVPPGALRSESIAAEGREAIRRGLVFLESTLDPNGAWHCIRFNVGNPGIPRHFERPAFVSAFGLLALESCDEPRARAIRAATRAYIANTVEYPGFWRYYRHLPQDLDSTTLCSLVIGNHPWILLGRNVPGILANRDEEGRFLTWVLAEGEPDVVARFRIEADPVVNANVIAYLGVHAETEAALRWLEALVAEERLDGSSKWYPHTMSIYYAIARAAVRVQPALDRLCPKLAEAILELREEQGGFGNILRTAEAVSALDGIASLERLDAKREVERFIACQHEDGSWPELLAFGDQTLKWGVAGRIGHASEALTTAFCIEALERLIRILES